MCGRPGGAGAWRLSAIKRGTDNQRIPRRSDAFLCWQMCQITSLYGALRADLEALFSTGLPNTPLHNVEINLVSGNFIAAHLLALLMVSIVSAQVAAQCEYPGDSKFITQQRVAVAIGFSHLGRRLIGC